MLYPQLRGDAQRRQRTVDVDLAAGEEIGLVAPQHAKFLDLDGGSDGRPGRRRKIDAAARSHSPVLAVPSAEIT